MTAGTANVSRNAMPAVTRQPGPQVRAVTTSDLKPRDPIMDSEARRADVFQKVVLPHKDAAMNLARWLTRNSHDAEDVFQEALLRAYRFIETFRGGNSRSWLLKIVRNTFYTWKEQNSFEARHESLEDNEVDVMDETPDGHAILEAELDIERVRNAMTRLHASHREILILREFEELSYKDIATIIDAPMGTVMSRLARARHQLFEELKAEPAGAN